MSNVKLKVSALILTGLLIAVIIGFSIVSHLDRGTVIAHSIIWGPYLTNTTTYSTIISFKPSGTGYYSIEYADDEYYTSHGRYSNMLDDPLNTSLHHILVSGLSPDTLYHYRLVGPDGVSSDYHFRTFGNGSFTFIVYGDTRSASANSSMAKHKIVADRIAGENASFVIHVGDYVFSGNDTVGWDDFFATGHDMLANLTIYPVIGNHEANSPYYYQAFGMPEWYSFDYGDAHFTVLDSNVNDPGGQAEWLRQDLSGSQKWKFVIFHHPLYSSENHGLEKAGVLKGPWENIMIQNGVDVVFNGHVHSYERIEKNGITYIIAGTGGAPFNDEDEWGPGIALEGDVEYTIGYVRVQVGPNELATEYVPVAKISGNDQETITMVQQNTVYDRDTDTRGKQAWSYTSGGTPYAL